MELFKVSNVLLKSINISTKLLKCLYVDVRHLLEALLLKFHETTEMLDQTVLDVVLPLEVKFS